MGLPYFDQPFINGLANEAIPAYRFCDYGGSVAGTRKISLADSGDSPRGISTDTFASGTVAGLAAQGRGKLQVLGNSVNIAPGDGLVAAADNSGKGIKAGSTVSAIIGAVALEHSTADDDIIEVLIIQQAQLGGNLQTFNLSPGAQASLAVPAFVVPTGCAIEIISGQFFHATVANAALVINLEKRDATDAVAAGTDMLATGFDLASTVITPVSRAANSDGSQLATAGQILNLATVSGSGTGGAGIAFTGLFRWTLLP